MNFFQAQQKAKRSTFYLVLLFCFGILITSMLLALVFTFVIYSQMDTSISLKTFILSYWFEYFFIVLPIIAFIMVLASFYKLYELKHNGGNFVAQSLGGRLILRDTYDNNEKKLLNIVEEMAIASGIAIPNVYIIEDDSINAFAAGFDLDDVVIGVTKGSIIKLTRDELQGVVAHEFSHIFNGDMKINMNLIGGLNGLLFIKELGRILMNVTSYSSLSKKSEGKNQTYLIGVAFFILGYFGYIIGEIIKAAISRQREYLADATAVQYTRNPFGIAGALKKIGGQIVLKSDLKSNANIYSHMFFTDIGTLFSTHPPLDVRIKRIDKNWNESYILDHNTFEVINQDLKETYKGSQSSQIEVMSILAALESFGEIKKRSVEDARNKIDSIPLSLKDELSSTFGSINLLLALTTDKKGTQASAQFDIIEKKYNKEIVSMVRQLWMESRKIDNYQALLLVELMIPTLKQLSKAQYVNLKSVLKQLIYIDGVQSYFEWLIEKIVFKKLDRKILLLSSNKSYTKISQVKYEIEYLLSFFIFFENQNDTLSQSIFIIATENFSENLKYIESSKHSFYELEDVLKNLDLCAIDILQKLMISLVNSIKFDDVISVNEYFLIKALGSYLDFPIPLEVQQK